MRRLGGTARIKLAQELPATLLLRSLTDGASRLAKPVERAQEPSVLLVPPSNLSDSAPPAGPQGVESAVVTDAVARVGLDIVPGKVPESGPSFEEGGKGGNHVGDAVPPRLGGEPLGGCEPFPGRRGRSGQHRFG